jgi:CHAT domain
VATFHTLPRSVDRDLLDPLTPARPRLRQAIAAVDRARRETDAIVRALHEHLGVVINEMGEVDDLVEGLRRGNPAPLGVHFSGHGGPGTLVVEDEHGDAKPVEIGQLLTELRRRAPDRLSRFFYLACCYGGDPVASYGDRRGLPATATALHRDGITQVVVYFGPVLDDLSTRAERVFYAEVANGRRTRDAVRLARSEMSRVQATSGSALSRDAGGGGPDGPMAFAWAQMVLYQRGPDFPLGTKLEGAGNVAIETTERRTERPYPNSRTRVLKAGFVGRRKDRPTRATPAGSATSSSHTRSSDRWKRQTKIRKAQPPLIQKPQRSFADWRRATLRTLGGSRISLGSRRGSQQRRWRGGNAGRLTSLGRA